MERLDIDLPAQVYTDPMESLPMPGPNQGHESPIQAYTDPTESPPTSVPNQEPEFLFQACMVPVELPLTPVPSQVPKIPPIQASTDITESTPTLVLNQLEAPDGSPVSQADTGPEELPPALEPDGIDDSSTDALSSACQLNEIAERTRGVTEQCWGNSHLRDEIPKSDCGGGGFRSKDEEEEVDLNMTGDEDSDDEDSDDEDDNLFAESGVTGISAWRRLQA